MFVGWFGCCFVYWFCYAVVIAGVYLFILLISCIVYCCLIGGGIRLRVGLGCGIGLFDCALWICLR